jgi:5-methylcytosine-specific restriction endonuclease McrA
MSVLNDDAVIDTGRSDCVTWGRNRKWKRRMVAELLARDGDKCWLCSRPMKDEHESIEHLVARSEGGTDDPENLALCHRGCNMHLANRPLPRKEKMRERWRRQFERLNARKPPSPV